MSNARSEAPIASGGASLSDEAAARILRAEAARAGTAEAVVAAAARTAEGLEEPPLIEVDDVRYSYGSKESRTKRSVLKGATAAFRRGTMYAVVGASGCGKSTLLSLLGGLDLPKQGEVRFAGEPLDAAGLAEHRRRNVSFVFQGYNLIDYLTAAENVSLATKLPPLPLLEKVGIGPDEARRNVLALSGGQQQRVAVARALASEAPVVLADEPTGNLDEVAAEGVADILRDTAHRMGKCVICVTHSPMLARKADRVFRLAKGRLIKA
ncbi:multidrug ABC transporter ATP-binding protein [Gordonibacter sp. An230]|uniref:ABC transporter ATP-binding protein n=1 Tax=Gordonibacter sp. An230 TaxID=1965592 RepID=UPI000B38C023|nr:ATP-binding cassette domain-containing protein [Gordonibacter sp. An230]OUO89594.1 multidrug ABC transporter ATP-binding protein [Gordonibacter sp. An230]